MKNALMLIAFFPGALVGDDDLRVTEVMSESLLGTDWFELTNFSDDLIDLTGWSWNDQTAISGEFSLPHLTLPPGGSLILLNGDTPEEFRNWWDLDPAIAIFSFRGSPERIPRFKATGDTLTLFSPDQILIQSFEIKSHYPGVTQSVLADGAEVPEGFTPIREPVWGYFESRVAGEINGWTAFEFASPGSVEPAKNFPPAFRPQRPFVWHVGQDLGTSQFRIEALDPNPGDSVEISISELPPWLTLVNEEGNRARLVGTPPLDSVGRLTLPRAVTDSHGVANQGFSFFTFDILPIAGPIILNEYNAVGPEEFLGGGAADDPEGDSDPRLGRIAGNGGLWAEFVLTGTITQPHQLDLRGWRFTFSSNRQTISRTLTSHPALAQIPSGTILTFTEDPNTSLTRLNDSSRAHEDGFLWTNLFLYDRAFIKGFSAPWSPPHWEEQLTVQVFDSTGRRVLGPVGESTVLRDPDQDGLFEQSIKVGSDEVFKLEEHPSSLTSAIFSHYDDGETSTFGAPNLWNQGNQSQDFTLYPLPNLPPAISGQPEPRCIRGQYQTTLTISDPEGGTITASLVKSPDFLELTQTAADQIENSLSRPVTPHDSGEHFVTVVADDGQLHFGKNYFTYKLTVANPAPTVIINEVNFVTGPGFLNGGTQDSDLDGPPPAGDSFLGRIQGNGGDWIELAILGDGGPSVVDLSNWKLEIGRNDRGGNFTAETVLRLDIDPRSRGLAAGSLVVIRDRNSPYLPTSPQTNKLATEGWQSILFQSLFRPFPNFDLDAKDTLIRIVNSQGRVEFGPLGETTVSTFSIGNDEILELEAHPSTAISPFDGTTDLNPEGYDDSDSESTFARPNRFLDSTGTLVSQDFSRFILANTSFSEWASGFVPVIEDPSGDRDLDGFTNLQEYLGGSLPTDPTSSPAPPTVDSDTKTASFEIRVNDPTIEHRVEYSSDLVNWRSDLLMITDTPSPKGPAFRLRTAVWSPTGDPFDDPRVFDFQRKRYFRLVSELETAD